MEMHDITHDFAYFLKPLATKSGNILNSFFISQAPMNLVFLFVSGWEQHLKSHWFLQKTGLLGENLGATNFQTQGPPDPLDGQIPSLAWIHRCRSSWHIMAIRQFWAGKSTRAMETCKNVVELESHRILLSNWST